MPRRKRLRRNPMYVRAHDTESLDGPGRVVSVYTQDEVDDFRETDMIDYIAGIIDEKLTSARQQMASTTRTSRLRGSATRPSAAMSTMPRTSSATTSRSPSTTPSSERRATRSTRPSARVTPARTSTRSSSQDKPVNYKSAQIIGDALGSMEDWAGDFLRLAGKARRATNKGTTVQRNEVLGQMGLRESDAQEIINELRGVYDPSQRQAIVLDNFDRLSQINRLRLRAEDPMPSYSAVGVEIEAGDIDL
jgi:hypothetical protein